MDTRKISVLVADDHDQMIKVISTFLSEHFCVVDSVSSGGALVKAAVDRRPDVVVADIDMPGYSGIDAMLRLKEFGIEIPFVLLVTETYGFEEILSLGAAAYVHKYDIYADLKDAVVSARTGRKFISRSIQEKHVS